MRRFFLKFLAAWRRGRQHVGRRADGADDEGAAVHAGHHVPVHHELPVGKSDSDDSGEDQPSITILFFFWVGTGDAVLLGDDERDLAGASGPAARASGARLLRHGAAAQVHTGRAARQEEDLPRGLQRGAHQPKHHA